MRWLDDAWLDARYAVRALRRSPGFATVAILTLALAIGTATAISSVVDAILLQPLPFTDSDRLVRIVENVPFALDPSRPPIQRGVPYLDFLEWRARTRTLTDTFALAPGVGRLVQTAAGTVRLWGTMTSGDAFARFGARPLLGRTLDPADDNSLGAVVLSFETWRRHFGSSPEMVGTTLEFRADWDGSFTPELEHRVLTVVGIMPAGFEFPTGPSDYYAPIAADAGSKRFPTVSPIGRLRPGVSAAAANEEANVIGSAIRPPRPANAPVLTVPRFEVQGLKERMVRQLRPALRVFFATVGVVLLIACANVANLLLARGTARHREMGVRVAIGAGRGRIVRQIMTECLVLAAAGGTLGALLGAASVTLVKKMATIEAPGIFRLVFGATLLPRANEVGVDLRMFAIASGVAAFTSVIFGLLPALHLSRTSELEAMGSRGSESGRGAPRVRAALAIAQLVMATVLLVGAGLLLRSFARLTTVETGFNPSKVLAFQLVFPADYSVSRRADTIEVLLSRFRASPGVEAAGFARAGVLITEELVVGVLVPRGRTVDEMRNAPARPRVRSVSDGYLSTIGARLVAGRELEAPDAASAQPAIVINRTAARLLFGTVSPVGQVVDWYSNNPGKGNASQARVVGVIDDIRNTTPDREPVPEAFVDYRQLLTIQQRWGDSARQQNEASIGFLSFAIRTTGDPASSIPSIGRIVAAADRNVGVESLLPMSRLVKSNVARQRFYAVMLGAFAAIAALLAAIGIYGVLAYGVVQRTREIGIRMALGARRGQVFALVLGKGILLTTIGIAVGLAGAAAGTRLLQGMLFGVSPLDPTTFAVTSLLFGAVATVASYFPARRATRVDPIVALRSE
jgi:putative ABC transport system permease protein